MYKHQIKKKYFRVSVHFVLIKINLHLNNGNLLFQTLVCCLYPSCWLATNEEQKIRVLARQTWPDISSIPVTVWCTEGFTCSLNKYICTLKIKYKEFIEDLTGYIEKNKTKTSWIHTYTFAKLNHQCINLKSKL